MKKIATLIVAFLAVMTAGAQVITDTEIDNALDELYPGANWVETAMALSQDIRLDSEGNMIFQKVIPCQGSKTDIYIAANQWFTTTFDDAKGAITLNDKESGTIIAQPLVPEVAEHSGTINHYVVSLQPIIRVDIKDGKVRIKYTLQSYEVGVVVGAGWLGDFDSMDDFDEVEKWPIKECYPYVSNDKQKKTSSKAFVVGYVYSKIVMDKFEKTMKKMTSAAANDNW